MSVHRIHSLLQDVVVASNSAHNLAKASRWAHSPLADKDLPRDAPSPAIMAPLRDPAGVGRELPFTVDVQLSMYGRILGFSLSDYFQDLEAFLESELTVRLYRFATFDDDAYLAPNIRMQSAFTPIVEISAYGMPPTYAPETTPWCEGAPVIIAESDLEQLPRPDFFHSGIMPQAHRWYRDAQKIVGNAPVAVDFPSWLIGLFGIACRLRGFEQLLVDMYERPAFVHRLMRRLTDDRLRWIEQRDQFLGSRTKAAFGDDDIGSPTISSRLFEEFVLPYEIELSRRHGGIYYWHSCNYTDPLLGSIKKVPDIHIFHAGPWNYVPLNVETWCPQTGLEICLNPEEILGSSDAEMQAQLTQLVAWTRGTPSTIRADCFDVRHDLPTDLAHIQRWAALARQTISPAP